MIIWAMKKLWDILNPPTMTIDPKAGTLKLLLYRWYKPWTWRHGSRKGDEYIVDYETEWVEVNDDG